MRGVIRGNGGGKKTNEAAMASPEKSRHCWLRESCVSAGFGGKPLLSFLFLPHANIDVSSFFFYFIFFNFLPQSEFWQVWKTVASERQGVQRKVTWDHPAADYQSFLLRIVYWVWAPIHSVICIHCRFKRKIKSSSHGIHVRQYSHPLYFL